MPRKLYRSQRNKVLAGVCGGIGEYANVDPTMVRVLTVFFVVFTGIFPGVVVYIILIFLIPEHPKTWREDEKFSGPPNRPWS